MQGSAADNRGYIIRGRAMKVQTTAKYIKQNGRPIAFNYCDIYNLMKDYEPAFYTCGIYGWNANIYDFGSFQIVTGYRPFGMDSHKIPFRTMEKIVQKDPSRREEISADFITLCEMLASGEKLDEKIIKKYMP